MILNERCPVLSSNNSDSKKKVFCVFRMKCTVYSLAISCIIPANVICARWQQRGPEKPVLTKENHLAFVTLFSFSCSLEIDLCSMSFQEEGKSSNGCLFVTCTGSASGFHKFNEGFVREGLFEVTDVICFPRHNKRGAKHLLQKPFHLLR
jgi:hypothetical protein